MTSSNSFSKKLGNTFPVLILSLLLSGSSLAGSAAGKPLVNKSYLGGQLADTLKMVAGVPLRPEDISPLLVGESVPNLKLPSSSGKEVDLNKLMAEKPTILVFYRGGWCPFCSKQLAGLQAIEKDLAAMGYQLVAVSTDSPDNLSKTLGKQKLSYTLLSDADLSASKKFGIAFKGPKNYDKFLPETSGGKNVDKLLPVPSVFILDKKGSILFEYINPNITQRLSGTLLKAAASALLEEM